MLKSRIDVLADVRARLLEHVPPGWHTGDTPIMALFPDRATTPRKTRVFLDAMVEAFT